MPLLTNPIFLINSMVTGKAPSFIKILIVVFLQYLGSAAQAQSLLKRTTMLMGSKFEITVVATDSASAERQIDAVIGEVSRIENLISDWKSSSQVSEVNQNAGMHPVKVDREVYELTRRAISISEATGGAFDISFAAMEKVWKFDGSMTEAPSPEDIRKSVQKVGYKNIILDSAQCTIFLKLPGMKIGFGSIGKGYAADRGRQIAVANGIESGIVNASGDMRAWGRQPDGSDWIIGITNPFKPNKVMKTVPLRDEAVVTSGNYENYIVLRG